jgi:hypothetical protein
MMSLDLLGLVLLTAISALAIGLPALWYARAPGGIALLAAHILWFFVVVALAVSGALAWGPKFGAPLLGLSIVTSIVVVAVLATVVPATSRALAAIPLPALIGVHAIRIVGFLFLLLLATGRLSAPFATSAGCGDIIAGATAVPVAWALSARGAGVRWLVLVWNSFGLLDLLAAVTLGMTSAPGSPLQLFFDPPGSTAGDAALGDHSGLPGATADRQPSGDLSTAGPLSG